MSLSQDRTHKETLKVFLEGLEFIRPYTKLFKTLQFLSFQRAARLILYATLVPLNQINKILQDWLTAKRDVVNKVVMFILEHYVPPAPTMMHLSHHGPRVLSNIPHKQSQQTKKASRDWILIRLHYYSGLPLAVHYSHMEPVWVVITQSDGGLYSGEHAFVCILFKPLRAVPPSLRCPPTEYLILK